MPLIGPFSALTLPTVRQHFFNHDNAHAMAAKSAQARRERQAQLEIVQANSPVDQQYIAQRLVCVRTQIERLNQRLEQEQDPVKLEKLINGIYKLTELERVLSGRPLPGQLKPTAPRVIRPSAEPLR